MNPPTGTEGFVSSWHFVDTSDKASRKQSRLHAMRESARRQKWLQERERSRRAGSMTGAIIGDASSPSDPSVGDGVRSDGSDRLSELKCKAKLTSRRWPHGVWAASKMSSAPLSQLPSNSPLAVYLSSPMSCLGAGRVDPFKAFPVHNINHHLDNLTDFCEISLALVVSYTLTISRSYHSWRYAS
jgi:hypothetical protein